MTDTAIHVGITLPNVSGLAVDEFETSLNYQTVGVDSAGVSALIAAFFNNTSTHAAPASYINGSVSRSALCKIAYYDVTAHLDGSPHGAPFQVDTFTMGAQAGSTKNLPTQLCATLSYYSELDPGGTTTGRHRGRMFIGPLTDGVASLSVGDPRLTTAFCEDWTAALATLANAMDVLTNPKVLSVWSRANAGMESAIACFMENRFDTQRRRAVAATARTTVAT